jgi:predicted Zn-dependent peptidase
VLFREHRLANGLEIVAEVNDQARSLGLAFFVGAGARDETPVESGLSHFLEHMVFKGTASRSSDQLNQDFDRIGAHHNAYTSEERTVYYAAVTADQQAPALDLLADMLRPALREDDFNTEKLVILEEIKMYLDQPPYGADDLLRAAYFGAHPLGKSVLGSPESIRDVSVDAMRAYFDRRYRAENVTLVAAGAIDFPALVAQAERLCGAWPSGPAPRSRLDVVPASSWNLLHKPESTQQYLMQFAPGPAVDDPRRYAAKLLATILGDDTGSRLFWELVDPGVAESASLSHYDYSDAGLFAIYVGCSPDDIEENLDRLAGLLDDVSRSGLTEAELRRARNKLEASVVLSGERPAGRLFSLGGNWTARRRYVSVQDDLDALDRVTLADIHGLLADYPLSPLTTMLVGPRSDLASPPSS